ncbi:RNA-directed DNA polymerase, eukaryota [Tanacetum coccineum]
MIIAVYAPHDPRDKRMLWDYLAHVINQWQGEVVIMGDFNEVRVKSDRFGTNFNVLGANIFNSFINSTGLEEVHLGGASWGFFNLILYGDWNAMLYYIWPWNFNDVGTMMKDLLERLCVLDPSLVPILSVLFFLREGVSDPSIVKEAFKESPLKFDFSLPCHDRLKLNALFITVILRIRWMSWIGQYEGKKFVGCLNCGEIKSTGPAMVIRLKFLKVFGVLSERILAMRSTIFFKCWYSFHKGCKARLSSPLNSKVNDAKFVNDFRPISLIECVYKVNYEKSELIVWLWFQKGSVEDYESIRVVHSKVSWLNRALLLKWACCASVLALGSLCVIDSKSLKDSGLIFLRIVEAVLGTCLSVDLRDICRESMEEFQGLSHQKLYCMDLFLPVGCCNETGGSGCSSYNNLSLVGFGAGKEICSFSDWESWFLSFRFLPVSSLNFRRGVVFYVASGGGLWRLRNQLVFDASPS